MKKIQVALLGLLPIFCLAQKNSKDSSKMYEDRVRNIIINTVKNLKQSDSFKIAQNNLVQYNKRYNNYNSISVFGAYHKNDFASFNNNIKASGFSELKDATAGFGFAFTMKRKAHIVDFIFSDFTLNNKASKSTTQQEILLNTVEVANLQYGYAIVNTKNIVLYPYAGLGFRVSAMTLKNKQIINPTGTNISNYVVMPAKEIATSMKASYQLGLGLDIRLGDNAKGDRSTFLFTKVGINNAIGDEYFYLNDFKFNPDIKLNTLQVSVGLKFALRKTINISNNVVAE